MVKAMVERRICDIESCGSDGGHDKCPVCDIDMCYQHQAKVDFQSMTLQVCANCLTKWLPSFSEKAHKLFRSISATRQMAGGV